MIDIHNIISDIIMKFCINMLFSILVIII